MALHGFVWLVSSTRGTEEKAEQALQIFEHLGRAGWAINTHSQPLCNEVGSREDETTERGEHYWRSWDLPPAVRGLERSQLLPDHLWTCTLWK